MSNRAPRLPWLPALAVALLAVAGCASKKQAMLAEEPAATLPAQAAVINLPPVSPEAATNFIPPTAIEPATGGITKSCGYRELKQGAYLG